MDLHYLSSSSAYIDTGINLGLLLNGENAVLIDSGLDSSVAKKVLRLLKEHSLTLSGLILTHSHADHTGGASYLREKGIPVFASPLEKPFIENSWLEPFYLYGGAQPLKAMENKFLKAPSCPIDQELNYGKMSFGNFQFEVIDLAGHAPGQIGIINEGVCYLADALLAPEILKKHGLPYNVNLDLTMNSISFLRESGYNHYVPSHGPVVSEITGLAYHNMAYLEELLVSLESKLKSPCTLEELLNNMLCEKEAIITNPGQYYLMRASLQGLLSHLVNNGKAEIIIENNMLYWKR